MAAIAAQRFMYWPPHLDEDGCFVVKVGLGAPHPTGVVHVDWLLYPEPCLSPDVRSVGLAVSTAVVAAGLHRPNEAGGAGYWLELLVVLVVAVAQRRLGPSSSATTSTVDRALPSSIAQLRCCSRPTTTTRLPFESDCAACSAWSRHTTTVKNDASCSRRPDTATRNIALAMPAWV